MSNLSDEPPTDINPYEVLQLEPTASANDVKSAYKKLALKHHPDKVQQSHRDSAHHKFQEIAFAYAVLSDDRRRKRYDATGNTSESLAVEDDDFNWSDFFKAQWADTVTLEKLNNFKTTYKHSEEEKKDLLTTYQATKGDLDAIFARVMLSNPLEDEDRFRTIINDAIAVGEVESYKAFTQEAEKKRLRRQRKACGEGQEAEEYAKELGIWDDLFGNAKKQAKSTVEDPDAALKELIQKRKRGSTTQFLDDLEAKYGGGPKKSKKQKFEEPPDELFQKNRQKIQKAPPNEADVEEADDIDLDVESVDSPRKGTNGASSKRTTKRDIVTDRKEGGKSTKSKSNGVKGSAKKPSTPDDESAESVAGTDDNEEEVSPVKSKRKSNKGRVTRNPRSAKKTSYKEAESSESDFEGDEKEQDFKPTKSKGKGAKGRSMAVRKKA